MSDPFTPERLARHYHVTDTGEVYACTRGVHRANQEVRRLAQTPDPYGHLRVRITVQGRRRWFGIRRLRSILASAGITPEWVAEIPAVEPEPEERPTYLPTPAEIAAECARIRSGWMQAG